MSTNTSAEQRTALPHLASRRVVGGVHANLFSSKFNSGLTIIGGALVILALWFGLNWIFFDADWTVIKVLGGKLAIGPYNTDAACPGNDCAWRPQTSLLLVMVMLGDGMGNGGRRPS